MENYIINFFIKNYGLSIINHLKNIIKKEIENSKFPISFSENYFLYIFQFAFFEFCGIKSNEIPFLINKMSDKNYYPNISFSELKSIHSSSIELIKNYLNQKNSTN